jgi:hypothetical protein
MASMSGRVCGTHSPWGCGKERRMSGKGEGSTFQIKKLSNYYVGGGTFHPKWGIKLKFN